MYLISGAKEKRVALNRKKFEFLQNRKLGFIWGIRAVWGV
jgi:hypothetical protein